MQLFSIPNLLTGLNLLCGTGAIIVALAGRIDWAPFLIILAAVFDFLDGLTARLLNQTSPLGKQLDSLADIVSFGVAPGIMMLVSMVVCIQIEGPFFHEQFASHVHFLLQNWFNALFYQVPNSMDASIRFLPLIALFIPFIAMFRLAKFNLDERQTDRFIGVPTPLASLFFCFYPLVLCSEYDLFLAQSFSFTFFLNVYVVAAIVVLVSLLMVAELPLFSLKFKNFRWKDNQTRYIFLFLALILLIIFKVWAIPLVFLLQICLSVLDTLLFKPDVHEI
jgi:CDP-diacylglycerol--serine O-phosphatidyltransferase